MLHTARPDNFGYHPNLVSLALAKVATREAFNVFAPPSHLMKIDIGQH